MEEVMISICVPTYGHEKYIRRALDSILMQETQYSFEVLIGEDASPDRTKEILYEYENKYPGFFTVFYRDHNMNKEDVWNALDLRNRAKGKYIVTLEGDDYWIDSRKIEKQVSFLEAHPEYLGVAHNCVVVDENSMPNGEVYPECKEHEYSFKHFIANIFPGQLTTLVYRNKCDRYESYILNQRVFVGDRPLFFALISSGRVYCIQETMSAYRHVVKEGTSFSATVSYNFEKHANLYRQMIIHAKKTGNKKAIHCAEALFTASFFTAIRRKSIGFKECLKCIQEVSNFPIALVYLMKRSIYRKRFKRKNKNVIS